LRHCFPCGSTRVVVCAALAILLSYAGAASAQTTVPAPWLAQDIGAPVIPGQSAGTATSFTITAGGADIWGTSDQFHFVYQRVTGDVDVRARIRSVSPASAWSKAGVMIRASLDPSSPHAYMLASAAKGLAFQRRAAAGGVSENTAGPAVAPPQWVRLVRAGSTVTAYTSSDGNTWTSVGSATVALPATAYVGIAVSSHNEFSATTALVSNVSVLPAGLTARDIGAPPLAGTTSYNSGTYTITASGRDIWDTADQFQFVFARAAGDLDVSARVVSIGYADRWSKAGVMIRESLDAGSRHAMALASAGRGYAFQRRMTTNGLSENTAGPASPPPGWVRLTRVGDLFTAYVSTDGQSWQIIGTDTIPMASQVYVGLAVTSHDVATYTISKIDSLSVRIASTPSPSQAPTAVAFQASADNATLVTSYRLDVFAANADTTTATPVASIDVGKPTPDANGDITVTVPDFFSALPTGSYQLTVSAVGTGGIGRSAPIAFTR
jgi:regulation of enolase protein 1 (concanavalin A-like superfamily)